MGKKVLIIGGVACGGKVAARLRRLAPGEEITVLEKGEFLSYAGCGLPFYVQGIVKEYRDLHEHAHRGHPRRSIFPQG